MRSGLHLIRSWRLRRKGGGVPKAQSGANNPNWKGGRTVDPRGYVLILVGKDHPLADVRGYAYEHRLIAQERADHPLTSKEQVHHDNEQKGDNVPDNLILTPSIAHHRFHHRTVGWNRQLPDEPNREVQCQCGCGARFLRYDASGRPRAYVSGHNPQEAWLRDAAEKAILNGASTLAEIAAQTPAHLGNSLRVALSVLAQQGKVVRRMRGVYGPPGSSPLKAQETVACGCGCGTMLEKYDRNMRQRRYVSGHNRRRTP